MKAKRMKGIALCLVVIFGMLLYRLADIQLLSTEDFGPEKVNLLAESVQQRSHHINLSSGRGNFIDRNKKAITQPIIKDIVLFPFLKQLSVPFEDISTFIDVSPTTVEEWIKDAKEPFFLTDKLNRTLTDIQYQKLKSFQFPGLIAVERRKQGDPEIARQFIGYVRENPEEFRAQYGVSGLEKSFDPFLQSEEEEKLLYHVDAIGEPIYGLNVKYVGQQSAFYPVKIETTLDLDLQEQAEKLVNQFGLQKGALLLLDVESRDVLAMVSRPKVEDQNPLIPNQVLTAHPPGSIFKTVIAAAAIDHPAVNTHRLFNCNLSFYEGEEPERKLGMLDFENSFSQSCNRTFGELAQEMMAKDPEVIENYARKLGLTERAGWKGDIFHFQDFEQFDREESTTIWRNESDKRVPLSVAQTSIGQLNVRVTPLSIANMMATIASDGIKKEVRAVSSILYKNDSKMVSFPEHIQLEDRLSPYNTHKLQELLYRVVNDDKGTGRMLKGLEVAGKSGTAEIDEGVNPHHWFAGYFPYQNPRYAMVVVNLNGQTASPTYNVYKNMVEYIYRSEQTSNLQD